MKDFGSFGLTQKTMSLLSGANLSTINRSISSKKIKTITQSSSKNLRYSIKDTRVLVGEHVRDLMPIQIKKKVQSFYNFKGGTGKTSVCFQVASHMALCGYKVLIVDSDPQSHLSTSLGFLNSEDFLTLYDVIENGVPVEQAIKNVYEGLDCIPANLSLTRIELSLGTKKSKENTIEKSFLPILDKYDFVFFDTNPTISQLNRNIVFFSGLVNIVCETQPYSLNGLKLLSEDIKMFFESIKKEIPNLLIIPNKYEDRSGSSAEAMTALRSYYGDYLIEDFAIRKSEDFNTSARLGLPLGMFCKSNSIAFEDIVDLLKEIIKRSCEEK